MTTTLHNQIMNIPAKDTFVEDRPRRLAYLEGHRDARHEAARLASEYEASNSEIADDVEEMRVIFSRLALVLMNSRNLHWKGKNLDVMVANAEEDLERLNTLVGKITAMVAPVAEGDNPDLLETIQKLVEKYNP